MRSSHSVVLLQLRLVLQLRQLTRRLQALRAAKMDAYRNLAEQLYGLELAGETAVAEGRVGGDALRTRFTGTIAGAEIVSLEPLGNDSYQATIRLPAQYVAAARRDRR